VGLSRRRFLRNATLAPAALWVPSWAGGCVPATHTAPGGASPYVALEAPSPGAYETRNDPEESRRAALVSSEAESVAEAHEFLAANLPADAAYFVHISDMHIGGGSESRYPPFGDSGLEFLVAEVSPTPRAERAIREIGQLSPAPAFVVFTGDLSDHGQPDEIEQALSILASLDVPVHITRGNHEWHRETFLRAVSGAAYCEAGRMGEMGFCYTFDGLGARHIVLDSEEIHTGGPQFEWLRAQLVALGDTPGLVYTHRNLKRVGYPPSDYRAGFIQPNGDDVIALLQQYPTVQWVIGGHVHLNAWRMAGALNLVSLTALFYSNDDAHTTAQGYSALHSHLVCVRHGAVEWLARKRFGGSTALQKPTEQDLLCLI